MLKAVRHHTNCSSILLLHRALAEGSGSVGRWQRRAANIGNSSGPGCDYTILANLFLHYAFDMSMKRTYPHIPFERYADDAIFHCKSAEEAQALRSVLADRFAALQVGAASENTGSSTARMRTGAVISQINRSTFSVLCFGRGRRCGGEISPRMASCRRPVRGRWRPSAGRSAAGPFIITVTNPAKSGRDVQPVHSRLGQLLGKFYRTKLRPALKRIDLYVIRWARREFDGCVVRPKARELV